MDYLINQGVNQMKQGTGLHTYKKNVKNAKRLHDAELYPDQIAEIMQVDERSVYRYLRAAGISKEMMHKGRYTKLNDEVLQETQDAIQGCDGNLELAAEVLGLGSINSVRYRQGKIDASTQS